MNAKEAYKKTQEARLKSANWNVRIDPEDGLIQRVRSKIEYLIDQGQFSARFVVLNRTGYDELTTTLESEGYQIDGFPLATERYPEQYSITVRWNHAR